MYFLHSLSTMRLQLRTYVIIHFRADAEEVLNVRPAHTR